MLSGLIIQHETIGPETCFCWANSKTMNKMPIIGFNGSARQMGQGWQKIIHFSMESRGK
jgi:hypothetical protein